MEKTIKSYLDLMVYQNLYKAMIIVHKEIVPFLPKEEKYDLCDQMKRASKAAPALMAEGFAKRYQKRQWKKYLNDVLGECNEMIHHISVCIDIYSSYIDKDICLKTINLYDISSRQITKLGQSWQNYHDKKQD
jgi:four helix bundle protein